jgi:uncharacterized protein
MQNLTPLPAVKALLCAAACMFATGCAVVDHEQRRWIFMPTTQAWAPGVAAAQGMQEVWIPYTSQHPEQQGQPVRLHGLWLPRPEADAPVLLFLHGVRWDVRASAPRLRRLHALGFSVLGIDYRGFGQSRHGGVPAALQPRAGAGQASGPDLGARGGEAVPSESLAAEDARAAWAWLARRHPGRARYVAGHSVGANMAVRLAAEVDDEAGVIAEGGFLSAGEHFRSLRWGWLPITGLITQHFDAGSRVAAVGSPLLVVHGSEDSMISPAMGRALYERARQPKRFVLVEGGVHENADELGHAQLRQAVQQVFGIRPPAGQGAEGPAAEASQREPRRARQAISASPAAIRPSVPPSGTGASANSAVPAFTPSAPSLATAR